MNEFSGEVLDFLVLHSRSLGLVYMFPVTPSLTTFLCKNLIRPSSISHKQLKSIQESLNYCHRPLQRATVVWVSGAEAQLYRALVYQPRTPLGASQSRPDRVIEGHFTVKMVSRFLCETGFRDAYANFRWLVIVSEKSATIDSQKFISLAERFGRKARVSISFTKSAPDSWIFFLQLSTLTFMSGMTSWAYFKK